MCRRIFNPGSVRKLSCTFVFCACYNVFMYKVGIKVIRVDHHQDLAMEYLSDGDTVGPCPMHSVGDVFIHTGDNEKPEGLCPAAWLDICRAVTAISNGASYTPWNRREGQTIGCCGDGIRPVSFEITRIDDDFSS